MLLTQHGCIQQGVWSICCHLDPEITEKAVRTKVFNKNSDHSNLHQGSNTSSHGLLNTRPHFLHSRDQL